MRRGKKNQRRFRIREGNFADAYAFANELLTRKDISKETALETLLVFEALLQKLVDSGVDENTDLRISGLDKLGDFRIKIMFEGPMFVPDYDTTDSIEDRILSGHDDRIDCSYYSGCNTITISVSRRNRSLFSCAIAFLCAIVVYLPLSCLLDADAQKELLTGYVFPVENMYTNAMLMIGAPMTFFSLLKNLTNTYVMAQINSGLRQLQARTLITSALAIVLAFAVFVVMVIPLSNIETGLYGSAIVSSETLSTSFSDVAGAIVTPSIFEPFEAVSPVPLMVVALLCTYALCSAGKFFDPLRHAMMACYTLFSRMLHVTIAALPLFFFLAMLDVLLEDGMVAIIELFAYIAAASLGVLLLFGTYAVRLRANGIKVIPFVRDLIPLLRENLRIGSVINAAPYNTRYCAKNMKMSRSMLERNLPLLAEINLDGNCFLLMFFALAFSFVMGKYLTWVNIVGLGLLVLLLSLGAPNQPGSILIGMLILTTYLNSSNALCTAIYLEAFFGSTQNLINVIGDIVMVAIEDKKEKALA